MPPIQGHARCGTQAVQPTCAQFRAAAKAVGSCGKRILTVQPFVLTVLLWGVIDIRIPHEILQHVFHVAGNWQVAGNRLNRLSVQLF